MCLIKKKQELNSLVLIVPKTAPQNKSPQIKLIWGLAAICLNYDFDAATKKPSNASQK
jgi:hypothetical protein